MTGSEVGPEYPQGTILGPVLSIVYIHKKPGQFYIGPEVHVELRTRWSGQEPGSMAAQERIQDCLRRGAGC